MKFYIEKTGKKKELSFKGTLKELLAIEGINPTTVVLIKNGEVVLEDEQVGDDDEVQLLSVISGG
jgi:sulfur carrier protein ThiS